jgi:hypothetical protein
MNGKIVVALALIGQGVSDRANAVSEVGDSVAVAAASHDPVTPAQLPPTRLAEGGKLGDKSPAGQAGGRYGIGAGPRLLKGDEFITVMQNNTLSGTTPAGAAFNVYFLPGGTVSYRDATGARDTGVWHLDNGGVCVDWRDPGDKAQGCFRVRVDGDRVTLEGPSGSSRATLRGGISETFLKGAEQ